MLAVGLMWCVQVCVTLDMLVLTPLWYLLRLLAFIKDISFWCARRINRGHRGLHWLNNVLVTAVG